MPIFRAFSWYDGLKGSYLDADGARAPSVGRNNPLSASDDQFRGLCRSPNGKFAAAATASDADYRFGECSAMTGRLAEAVPCRPDDLHQVGAGPRKDC